MRLFFREWADRFECERVVWLDKEVFPDPPEGSRSVLDLVGKLPARKPTPGADPEMPATWLALIHIEIESPDKISSFRPRMFRYYVHLRERYQFPVLPIGLYLKVGLDGIGVDVFEGHFWELETVRFQYLYVGLPALDAIKYVRGDNWLGVALAALMKIPREQIPRLGAEALRRILAAPLSDQQRFLLGECVEAYLPLDEVQQREFEKLVMGDSEKGVPAVNKTSFEKGEEQGRREALREQLEDRFGPLPVTVTERLQQMSLAELVPLCKAILHAQSLKDLGFDV
ncbi:MAG: DUF4351 domain-containing protein [Planctomycetes bacterium]|nr:DUF4351 domain-containing protein [Planctomycetota bacterium]